MTDYNPAEYGDCCASFYDQLYPAIESGLLAVLADLAKGGPALDLGIGTGRVAIPLARAGIEVHGVEASAAMISMLHARPGGAAIRVVHGDFATVDFGARYRLIYALVSTFSLLPTFELQRACLRNIARHLVPGGVFLVEGFCAPDAAPKPERAVVPVSTASGVMPYRVTTLCAPPPLLDAMAFAARLGIRERWSNWRRDRFEVSARRHISVYALDECGLV